VLPTARVLPQVVDETAKLALAVMLLMFSVEGLLFLSVTVLGTLALSIATLPKFTEVGEMVKGGTTVSVKLVICVKLPEVPTISTVVVPIVAVPLAVSVSVLV